MNQDEIIIQENSTDLTEIISQLDNIRSEIKELNQILQEIGSSELLKEPVETETAL